MTTLLDRYGQGIHAHITPEDYYHRVLGEANKGGLDVVDTSLFHYRHWVDEEPSEVESATFTFGRAYHCALLEPARYRTDWLQLPDFGPMQSANNRRARAQFKERHADKSFLPTGGQAFLGGETMANAIAKMIAVVRAHPLVSKLVSAGRQEVTVVWIDPDTGLPCKARLDHHNDELAYALDPKTCDDASPEGFARSVFKFRYHVQAAHYCAGMAVCGRPLKHFFFLAQEKKPPYAVAVYKLNAPAEERGFQLRQRNMQALAEAVATDRWPSYNNDAAAELSLPAFAFYDLKD